MKYTTKKRLNQNLQIDTIDDFCQNILLSLNENKKIILIGGASSSGKGYTANILSSYLKQKGFSPLVLSTDSYYKGVSHSIVENAIKNNPNLSNKVYEHLPAFAKIVKEVVEFSNYENKVCPENLNKIRSKIRCYLEQNRLYPLQDEIVKGIKYEYENIDYDLPSAVNLRQVARDIKKVISGEKIIIPDYSFITGEPTLLDENTKIGKNYDLIIVEGIFALREELISELKPGTFIKTAINCDIKTLLTRKFHRDLTIGRCSHSQEEIIFNFLKQTLPSYKKYILPTMKNVDITFNSALSEKEIKLKSIQKQFKVKLDTEQYDNIIIYFGKKNIKPVLCERQIDHYLSPKFQNNNNIFIRIREVNGKAVGLTIKIKQDNNLNVDEFDLKHIISKEKQEINHFLENFKNAGFVQDFIVEKHRKVFKYKGFTIKMDDVEGLGKFAEFDEKNLNTSALSLFKQFSLENIKRTSYHDIKQSTLFKQNIKNNIEKEFKFKVDKLPKDYDEKQEIKQYYLSKDSLTFISNYFPLSMKNHLQDIEEVRVRFSKSDVNGERIYLTLKSNENQNRREIERQITFDEWKQVSKYAIKQISKTRYTKKLGGFNIEFDAYNFNDKNLYICEVETDSNHNYEKITQVLRSLDIKFKDVTALKGYKNSNLAQCL